ncbi:MAG TPA: pyridoxal phosphate-dependent aminotransferase [Polyangia bacterium]|jgi:aspartate aminotransferase
MHLSQRGRSVPPSPIRKLVPFAEAAKARGTTVYHLNIGQPDIPTNPVFWDAIRRFPDKVLAYGHSAGLLEYRELLGASYRRLGYEVTADDVTVTTGGSEAILFALMAICDPGDEVLCFEPFYTNYNGYAVAACVKLVPLACRAEDGYHLPSAAAIAARITKRTRAILGCTPNNPTGTVLTQGEMQMLGRLAAEHDLFFVSDETYRDFVYEGRHSGVLELGLGDRAVLIDSISKRFSACGARIGCLVTPNRDLNRAFLHFGQARLCPPSLEQVGAIALLGLEAGYFTTILEEYRARRDVLTDALAQMPGVLCKRPAGAFYAMARLPIDDANRFAQWLLTDWRCDGATVMVAPGDGFYATPGLGQDEVRFAYVLETPKLAQAMRCLAAALQAYPGRK